MPTIEEVDLPLPGGRVLHGYDTGATGRDDELAVFWHGGTPNTGLPPGPLLAVADRLGIRFLGADRPGYGGSTPDPDADVAAVAADVAAVADHAGVGPLGTFGHSGGGPRALATAALLPRRVIGAIAISSPAPSPAVGLDRYAGMAPGVVREQRAAAGGRAALTAVLAADEPDGTAFTPGDLAALEGAWSWFLPVVQAATASGAGGQVDDLLALARPWGFALAEVTCPVIVLHGAEDRVVPPSHGEWLAARLPDADLVVVAGGHISVLDAASAALHRLRSIADGS